MTAYADVCFVLRKTTTNKFNGKMTSILISTQVEYISGSSRMHNRVEQLQIWRSTLLTENKPQKKKKNNKLLN